jgi:hypothetical protein
MACKQESTGAIIYSCKSKQYILAVKVRGYGGLASTKSIIGGGQIHQNIVKAGFGVGTYPIGTFTGRYFSAYYLIKPG